MQDDTKVLLTEILLDPMYDYAATVARIDGSIPMHKPRTPKEAEYEFKTVIGRTPAELLSQKEFYDKIYTSKYRPDFTQLTRLNDIYFQEESLRVWWGGRDEEKPQLSFTLEPMNYFLSIYKMHLILTPNLQNSKRTKMLMASKRPCLLSKDFITYLILTQEEPTNGLGCLSIKGFPFQPYTMKGGFLISGPFTFTRP